MFLFFCAMWMLGNKSGGYLVLSYVVVLGLFFLKKFCKRKSKYHWKASLFLFLSIYKAKWYQECEF